MINKVITLFVYIVFICTSAFTQTQVSSGEVVYSVTYNSNKYNEKEFKDLPSTVTYSFKGNVVRKEFPLSKDYKLTTLVDCNKKVVYVLKDISGKKTYQKFRKCKVNKDLRETGTYNFSPVNSTKVIAGYNCSKSTDQSKEMEAFSSTAIQVSAPNWNTKYQDISGFLMEFSTKNSDYAIHYIAQSVNQKDLPSHLFEVPSEYTKEKRTK